MLLSMCSIISKKASWLLKLSGLASIKLRIVFIFVWTQISELFTARLSLYLFIWVFNLEWMTHG